MINLTEERGPSHDMRVERERPRLLVEVAAYLRVTMWPKKVVESVLEKWGYDEEGDKGR